MPIDAKRKNHNTAILYDYHAFGIGYLVNNKLTNQVLVCNKNVNVNVDGH